MHYSNINVSLPNESETEGRMKHLHQFLVDATFTADRLSGAHLRLKNLYNSLYTYKYLSVLLTSQWHLARSSKLPANAAIAATRMKYSGQINTETNADARHARSNSGSRNDQ